MAYDLYKNVEPEAGSNWKGDSDKSNDKAFISLIFEIGGEALRPVSGGLERAEGAVQAWKLVLRS